MKPIFRNTLRFWAGPGLGLALTASAALAVQVPYSELIPDPEKTIGDPVVLIQLAPDQQKETAYREFKKDKQYILGYREISLLNLNTDQPVLKTWTYNLDQKQASLTLFNWKDIDSIQVLNSKVILPRPERSLK